MASITFTIPGLVGTIITVTEVMNDGVRELQFDITLDETSAQGDLRGLFFDVADESLLGNLSVSGDDVTRSSFNANSVTDLGQGVNMRGSHTNKGRGFDGGVMFGTPGIGKDDIDSTSFTLSSSLGDLNLDILSEMRFGVRLTSVGDDSREGSLKLVGDAPYINLPPDAYDDGTTAADRIVVESGDSVMIDVLANDEDRDGTLDPASIVVSGGALGTATASGGQVLYTANDLTGTAADDSAADTVSYTVDDNEGATSNTANATVHVIDPLAETDTDSRAAVANGQLITLEMTTEDRTYNDESEVDVTISFGDLDQKDVNISFVVDGSGSIDSFEWNQQMIAVQDTIDLLRTQFAGTGTDVEIQLVQFSGDGYNANPAPEFRAATFDLFDAALTDLNTGTPFAMQMRGFTNYEAGLTEAVNFFTGQETDDNYMLFISDGQPNLAYHPSVSNSANPNSAPTISSSNPTYYLDEVAELNAAGVSITAVGFGGVQRARLDQIDNTGGAQVFSNASQLGDALGTSPLFPADVIEFTLSVNGTDTGATVADLVDLGGGDLGYSGDFTGLDTSAGAVNTVVATAGFDVDGDGTIDETRSVTTLIEATDGSDIFLWA